MPLHLVVSVDTDAADVVVAAVVAAAGPEAVSAEGAVLVVI